MNALKNCILNKQVPTFPGLCTPFVFRGTTYRNRRTNFLTSLSDEEYVRIFQRIHNLDDKFAFPNWSKVMRDDTQLTANVFHNIMKHVVCWILPAYKIPGSGSAGAVSYTWEEILIRDLMPLRNIEAVVMPWDMNTRIDHALSATYFAESIWRHASTYACDSLVKKARSCVIFRGTARSTLLNTLTFNTTHVPSNLQ